MQQKKQQINRVQHKLMQKTLYALVNKHNKAVNKVANRVVNKVASKPDSKVANKVVSKPDSKVVNRVVNKVDNKTLNRVNSIHSLIKPMETMVLVINLNLVCVNNRKIMKMI